MAENDDLMDEYTEESYQAMRLEAGLADPVLDEEIPQITTLAGNIAPSAAPQAVEGEFARMDPYAAEEVEKATLLGDKEGDGVLKTITKGVINGTIKAGESVSAMMAAGMNKFVPEGSDFRFKAPEPALLDTNVGGKMIEGVTQFGIQFYTGGTMLKAAGWAKSGKKLADVSRGVVQGVYADFTAFKGDEERLSNFLTEFDNPILNNTVSRYLAADINDSEFEGRMKNVIEGGAVGAALSVVVPAVRGLRRAKEALLSGDQKGAAEHMSAAREEVGQILDENQDFVAKNVPDEEMVQVPKPEVKAEPRLPTIWSQDEAISAINTIKALKSEDPDAFIQSATDVIGDNIHIDKLDTPEDVMAVMGALSEIKVPTFDTWSHETQLRIAKSRGMEVDTLKKYYELGAVNEQVLLSSEILLKKQSEKITDMINKNIDNNYIAAEVFKYQELLNMAATFKNISGRTLDANKILVDLKAGNIEGAQNFLTERFGLDKNFDKFKEAWVGMNGDLGALAKLNKMPVRRIIADSAVEIWKNGLLSGIKTTFVNFGGSYANLYKEIGVRFFSGLSGQARVAMGNLPPGSERVYMGESLAMAAAQVDGFLELMTSMRKMVTNPSYMKDFSLPKSSVDRTEMGYRRRISSDYWGIGTAPGALARYVEQMSGIPGMKTQAALRRTVDIAGSIVNTPGNLLNLGDGIAQNSARRTHRYALAYRKMMEEGHDSVSAMKRVRELASNSDFADSVADTAEDFAKRVTFQSELGANGQTAQKIIKGLRPFMDIPILEFIIPFVRTPVNIFKQGVSEVNPVFTSMAAMDSNSSFRKALAEGGIKGDEAMGRAAFGAALATTATMMAVNGMITGAGPTHDPLMMETLKRSGWRPYSIRVDNGMDANGIPQYAYYTYNRIEPAAWLMGSMASTIEKLHYTSSVNDRREAQWTEYAAAVMGSMVEATLDKSFFTGVSDFFEMTADPKRNIGPWASRMAGSFVPAISRDIEHMLQEKVYLRDIRSVEDAINAKLIGKSGEVPVSRNRWGDPVGMDEGWVLGGRSYFSPIGMSDSYAQPIDKEISRLAIEGVVDAEGTNKIFTQAMIAKPDRTITRHGVSIRLDNWQYSRLLEIAGKEIKRDVFGIGQDMTMRETLNYLVTKNEMYQMAGTYNPNNPISGPFPATQANLIKDTAAGFDDAAREQLFLEYPELQQKLTEAARYDMMTQAGIAPPDLQFQMLEQLNGRQ